MPDGACFGIVLVENTRARAWVVYVILGPHRTGTVEAIIYLRLNSSVLGHSLDDRAESLKANLIPSLSPFSSLLCQAHSLLFLYIPISPEQIISMVGVPGKYKGCNTCRARRVKVRLDSRPWMSNTVSSLMPRT